MKQNASIFKVDKRKVTAQRHVPTRQFIRSCCTHQLPHVAASTRCRQRRPWNCDQHGERCESAPSIPSPLVTMHLAKPSCAHLNSQNAQRNRTWRALDVKWQTKRHDKIILKCSVSPRHAASSSCGWRKTPADVADEGKGFLVTFQAAQKGGRFDLP